MNAKQAAIRAGYSERTAESQGSRLLSNAKVSAALQVAMAERSKRTEITADAVLAELARIGFADMSTFVSWGPGGVTLKDGDGLPEGASAAVAEVSQTVTKDRGTLRIKLHDKKGALDSLARHLGMFVDTKVVDVNFTKRVDISKLTPGGGADVRR